MLLPLAAACTPDRPPTGTSVPPPVTSVAPDPPTPSASPTPSQEELSAQAEKAYRTAFDEMERMAVAGGADDVSDVIKGVAAERFLVKYRTGLQDQKKRGYTVEGRGTTRVKATPGLVSLDYDPQLTLRICEDRTKTTWTEGGVTEKGTRTVGYVYGRVIDSRVKVVDIVSEVVDSCDF
ncbi:hypothetical protein [Enemella evansiae]|uniref:hypothetical protein n=1 Tax=Enemella evansiae TaxID=2016499 RepID=UPI001060EDEB|nr:hypothetical protein [Enemella evansiae]